MAKVLVVGGAGYIGSHVAKLLQKKGHQVSVFDDLSTGFRELAKYGDFHLGSILDPQEVRAVIKQVAPDAVLHFAARAAVGESVENPSLYYEVNVAGSYQLFSALRELAPKAKIIFSSTCAVYGAVEGRLNETLPLNPVNPYGRTKKMIEEMLADFSHAYDTRYVSLRYFNASGADAEGEIGEMHNPETHLIPRLLENALDPSFEMKIFGDKHATPDGSCIRDYIHVEDLADAHLRAMEYLLNGGKSDVFNLGTAKGSSVFEVLKLVESTSERKLKYQIVGARAGDPPALIADSSKIERVLGWKPKNDLKSIVHSAWSWIQKRPR